MSVDHAACILPLHCSAVHCCLSASCITHQRRTAYMCVRRWYTCPRCIGYMQTQRGPRPVQWGTTHMWPIQRPHRSLPRMPCMPPLEMPTRRCYSCSFLRCRSTPHCTRWYSWSRSSHGHTRKDCHWPHWTASIPAKGFDDCSHSDNNGGMDIHANRFVRQSGTRILSRRNTLAYHCSSSTTDPRHSGGGHTAEAGQATAQEETSGRRGQFDDDDADA
jgi:hypothetical protein